MAFRSRRQRLLAWWTSASVATSAGVAVVVIAVSRDVRQIVVPAGARVEGLTSVLHREVGESEVPLRFEEVTGRLGVAFHHFPAQRSSLIAEDMGSGLAWGDYDGDGDADLFLVNFAGPVLPGAPCEPEAGRSRLYRNDGGRRFVDVTNQAGIGFAGFGMAAAWGDYDGDGDLDLYVTAFGDNVLYANEGDGTFLDITARAGAQDSRFSSGCSWADYDRDGDLDLYVCNYVDFVFREGDQAQPDPQWQEQPYTLNPSAYAPLPNSLFRNNGDGTFTEVAAAAGVADPAGRGLTAAWVDMDNDGWPDLYVANDVSINGVFRNRGDGTFEDIGPGSLAADYRSAMGLAVADFDDDLDQDILITHWIAQENALYRNMLLDATGSGAAGRGLWFLDAADEFGLGQISLDMVGWATGFCDFDNDGRRDLWLVNGHTFESAGPDPRLLPQKPFVFWNRGPEGFVEVAARTCPRLAEPMVVRGGAAADFDGDGRLDLALMRHQEQAIILRNVSPNAGHWLRVNLRQRGGNTFAVNARVYVSTGGRVQMAEVGSSCSYLSQDELTLHFGLGRAARVDQLRIVWPDGAEETHRDLESDRTLTFSHQAVYRQRPSPGSE